MDGDMESKINWIGDQCKGEVSISINPHRTMYCSVEEYLKNNDADESDYGGEETKARMIEWNRIVSIRAFPATPVGHYQLYDDDLATAIDRMIEILKEERQYT